ncbi:ribonuclease domain-containing protein [Corynebacterium sp. NPDC060344]|uniref:ribonuclease domain-containing protein n=1 Tax=Corynebacterium sp. NPDC060344 TaxID=3347101 RepID=UPI00364677D2
MAGNNGNGGGKTGKGILAGAGALVLALAAAWLGIDGSNGTDGTGGSGDTGSNNSDGVGNGGNSGDNGRDSNGGGNSDDTGGDGVCSIDSLPPQADDVVDRILTNQDHIHSAHDGKHFGNYEGILPQERGSFYREYTVDTPGLDHRGARRIVVGGGTEDDPDVWYYTDDHYESFCEIPDAED